MLVYEENEQSLSMYAWNAVEVLVDGLLQLGRVVNVVENGLIIDFGCTSQRSHFVEYGRVFYSCRTSDPLDPYLEPKVQILLRAGPLCPWVWYPGKAVSLGDESYYAAVYIVEVQLPHGVVKELLPMNQVRRSLSDADLACRRVQPRDLVIRGCPLPTAWSGASRVLREVFPSKIPPARRVWCTQMLSQTLLYLQHRLDRELEPYELEELYQRLKKKYNSKKISRHLPLARSLEVTGQGKKRKPRGSCDAVFQSFPSELLVEVFRLLDSIHRTRYRRVCALWNAILTTDAYFPDVRVSCRREDCPSSCMAPLFWALSCLLHCVNTRTKKVIVMHMNMSECDDADTLVRYVLGRNCRVGTLVFYECWLHYEGWDMSDTISGLRRISGMAERVVWLRCRVAEELLTAVVPQDSITCQPNEQVEVHLWDMFERNLVVEKPIDLTRLSAVIKDKRFHQLRQILCDYQSVDPRFSTHYRGRQWTPSDLADLDVSRLTPVTVAALYNIIQGAHWLSQSGRL
ncbi:uncharacterized protein LOC129599069 [Paramacrobiotus metropolitanus]|uniref:uncharacterized protein LOC129599069 n=1 Tax=Paramacrobiotus metropolitanus TaxID=2943436 RepID=UPI002445E4F9|nr:uncharacterized protein LOC129599069 [Paramacrobiotus metropolitanus]